MIKVRLGQDAGMIHELMRFVKRVARRILKRQLKKKNFMMRDSADARRGLVDLMASLGDRSNLTMLEVGSYKGESAEIFLKTGKVAKMICIDPWKMFYDDNDGAAFTDMQKVEAEFDCRFNGDSRVVKVKGTIDDFIAAHSSDLPSVDIVYVDGCHTYEAVKHDLETALAKLKPRVAIAGHDYNGSWIGACRAVNEVIGNPDAVFSDTSWIRFLNR